MGLTGADESADQERKQELRAADSFQKRTAFWAILHPTRSIHDGRPIDSRVFLETGLGLLNKVGFDYHSC